MDKANLGFFQSPTLLMKTLPSQRGFIINGKLPVRTCNCLIKVVMGKLTGNLKFNLASMGNSRKRTRLKYCTVYFPAKSEVNKQVTLIFLLFVWGEWN